MAKSSAPSAAAGAIAASPAGAPDRPESYPPTARPPAAGPSGSDTPWPGNASTAQYPRPFRYQPRSPLTNGGYALQWQAREIAALRAGDVFAIELPMGRSPYIARVAETIDVPGGRRLAGRLHDNDVDSWPFSLTVLRDGGVVVGNFSANGRQFSIQAGQAGGQLRDITSESQRLLEDQRSH